MRVPGLLILFAVVFVVQFGEVSWSPILPLRLSELTNTPAETRTATGLICTFGALTYGLGAWAAGRWHGGPRYVPAVLAAACIGFTVAGIAATTWMLADARAVVGMFGGMTMTLSYGQAVRQLDARGSKASISLVGGASMLGRAVSPFAAGTMGQATIVAVFFVDAFVYFLCLLPMLIWIRRSRPEQPR